MKRTIFLVRGLPSSGKSTLVILGLGEDFPWIFEADTYFINDGKYVFDPKKLPAAHEDCRQRVENTIRNTDRAHLVVSNTFTQRWEMEPYIELSRLFGLELIVIDLFDGGCDDKTLFDRNKHGVPLESIARMRERYEHDWRAGNPIPPWERVSKE